MAKSTFIRATEIWTPTADRRELEFAAGLYGDMTNFAAASKSMRFAFDEGLPGKAWAEGRPIVLKDLANSYFLRGAAAAAEGLTCAVALPIFVGQDLSSVMVFFCGDSQDHVGALEVWGVADGDPLMRLVDGYFGIAEKFEFTSRHTTFPPKMGLPGKVWDKGVPSILADLGRGDMFLRSDHAAKVGINRAVALPCSVRGEGVWVLSFLSALDSPIAERFECWLPDEISGQFRYAGGYCERSAEFDDAYGELDVPMDVGALGKARISGVPQICTDLANEPGPVARAAAEAGLQSMVAMPVYSSRRFTAMLVWYI